MSERPAPADLLSTERLTEIGRQLSLPRARNPLVTEYGEGADVAEELFDHLTAYRQQVADALRGLLQPAPEEWDSNVAKRLVASHNATIRAAAASLGIDLNEPQP